MSRVLLINPPDRGVLNRILGIRAPPLGLMYIAACLERTGVPVDILDANLSNKNHEEVALEVKRRRPEIVGLSAVTPTIKVAMKIVKEKQQRPLYCFGAHLQERRATTLNMEAIFLRRPGYEGFSFQC